MELSKGKKVARNVLPAILGSCCYFLFSIVDGIIVGRGVGTDALGAVNLALPFVMLISALFTLASVGGGTVIAIRLGRKDNKGANSVLMNALVFTTIIGLALTIIGTCFTTQLTNLLGANETYFQMTYDYIFWYSVFVIPSGLGVVLQVFCRNDNSPVLVGVAVAISTVMNIFLDWLFVFPMQMGVAGAAIATGISQVALLLTLLFHFFMKKGMLRFGKFTVDGALIRKITGRGFPEAIAITAAPITIFCMNYVLINNLGNLAVNAFSVMCYIFSLSIAIFFGTAEGLQPLFGSAYGEKNEKDLKYYFRIGLSICLFSSVLIFISLFFVGEPIGRLFGASPEATALAATELPKLAWGFIPVSLNTMISAYLYSTKRTKQAVTVNVVRGLISNTLIIMVLPIIFGKSIIWYTFGIYECIAFVVAFLILKQSEKNGITFS